MQNSYRDHRHIDSVNQPLDPCIWTSVTLFMQLLIVPSTQEVQMVQLGVCPFCVNQCALLIFNSVSILHSTVNVVKTSTYYL